METYRVSCKTNTANENASFRRNKENRLMLVEKCLICGKIIEVLLKIKKQVD